MNTTFKINYDDQLYDVAEKIASIVNPIGINIKDDGLDHDEFMIYNVSLPEKMLIIEADENDGDYRTENIEITEDEIKLIRPVIEAIKQREKNRNWETYECERDCTPKALYVDTGILTQSQVDMFSKFVPSGDPNNMGIHSIISIKIVSISETLL